MNTVFSSPGGADEHSSSDMEYRKMVEDAGDLIVKVDRDGRFLYVSPGYCAMFGKSPEELLGHAFMPLVHEEDLAATAKAMKTLHRPPYTAYMEQRAMTRNGWRWLAWSDKAVLDEHDRVIAIIGLGRDITENKLAKESLIEERNRSNDILEGTNAGTWNWNVQTGDLRISARWAEIIGRTYDELKPISVQIWRDNLHPDDLDAVSAVLERHCAGELDYYDVEFRQSHKNGGWVWVNARGKVVEWTDDGKPLRMSSTHLDITERKRAEEQRQLAANVFTYAREGIMITDADGTIIQVNDAFTRITGYPRDEVLGKNPSILKSDSHEKGVYEAMWHALIQDGHWYGEIWNRRKNGELFAEMLTISAVKDAPGKDAALCRAIYRHHDAEGAPEATRAHCSPRRADQSAQSRAAVGSSARGHGGGPTTRTSAGARISGSGRFQGRQRRTWP